MEMLPDSWLLLYSCILVVLVVTTKPVAKLQLVNPCVRYGNIGQFGLAWQESLMKHLIICLASFYAFVIHHEKERSRQKPELR